MTAKRKRGGGKGRVSLSARAALLLSLLAEAVSLAVFWLVIGNLAALVSVWRPLVLCGLAGCLVGWFCLRSLAGPVGRGGIVLAWLLYLLLAAIELRLLSSGILSSFPSGGG